MLSRTKILFLLAVSLTDAACGLKGPLYRPDEPAATAVEPTAQDPASPQKKKDPTSVSPPDPDRPAVPPDR
jgi:predicted small lipoprotein YifL